MLIVSGHEDYRRRPCLRQQPQDVEAAHPGHLDVEEHEIGRVVVEERNGLRSGRRFAHELETIVRLERSPQAAPRRGLVVHDRDSHPVHVLEPCRSAVNARGIVKVAHTPRPGEESSSPASAP